ncbi:MAG TPA: M14 family metallopeptidase [Chloroflexota bacterium]|nr:M14 family metallopeptidase [Chloroflexota bacterium]
MRPFGRYRIRRWLLTGSMVTGGFGVLGLFRRVVAAPEPAHAARQGRAGPTPAVLPAPVILPGIAMTPEARSEEAPVDSWFEIGRSILDTPIRAIRLGTGPVRLALMGSIHGGWERNTERLVLTAYEHFLANPGEIPSALSLFVVPTSNPDGLAAGSGPDAAWNSRGVDLNRNFDTPNWSQDTFGRPGGRYGPTGTRKGAGGTAPFSEPETRVIRDFVLQHKIGAVISYHSGIVSVSARDGGGGIGEPLAQEMAAITGYPYLAVWTAYKLTGQFMDWLDGVGVKGVEVDLPNQQSIDWEQNLAAIKAVMAALAAG